MLPSFRMFVTKLTYWTDIKLIEFCPVRLQCISSCQQSYFYFDTSYVIGIVSNYSKDWVYLSYVNTFWILGISMRVLRLYLLSIAVQHEHYV